MLDSLLCWLDRTRVRRGDRDAIVALIEKTPEVILPIRFMKRLSGTRVQVLTGWTVHPLAGEFCDITVVKDGDHWKTESMVFIDA